jgi:hypothetical protein
MTKLLGRSKDALVLMALSVQKCTVLICFGWQREPSDQENQQYGERENAMGLELTTTAGFDILWRLCEDFGAIIIVAAFEVAGGRK